MEVNRRKGGGGMQTIYLDVLLVFNLYVNYILLRMTARLTHCRLGFGRCLGVSALGSLSTLMIFLPPLPLLLSVLCKLLVAVLLCLCAFGVKEPMRLCWCSICLFVSSFVLAGILLGFSLLCGVRVLHSNSCWYPDVSLLHLVLFTIAAYFLLHAVQYMHDRTHTADGGYRVCIRYRCCTAQLEGIADTGNSLVDFFTGKPVIICDGAQLHGISVPDTETPVKGFRLLPCSTVSGKGVIPVFRPDEVVIYSEQNGRCKKVDALIGISDRENQKAIFNPKLLRL